MNLRTTTQALLLAVATSLTCRANPFDGVEHDILDLQGRTVVVDEISQKEWNGLKTVVSNGQLRVTDRYWTHGGLTSVGPGATLAFGPNAELTTGRGDAKARQIVLDSGSCLRMENVDWDMDHTTVSVSSGAEWFADVSKLTLSGTMTDNVWEIRGRAIFPQGINVVRDDWGCELTIVLKPGGELWIGGPLVFNGNGGSLKIVLEGGTLGLFWDVSLGSDFVRVASGAEVTVAVSKNVQFDSKAVAVPDDARVSTQEVSELPIELPARYALTTYVDTLNRCYYISADQFRDRVKTLTFTYPNPDAESEIKFAVERPSDTVFRKRFPSGEGPWSIHAEILDVFGDTYETNIVIRKRSDPKRAPAPNDLVMVGQCGYGEATDLTRDIFEQDLCNLYVGWDTASKALPEKWPEAERERWAQLAKDRKMWTMSIYSGDDESVQKKLNEAYGGRYLGNNVGEYASYLYQGDASRPASVPNDQNLLDARNHFVNRYVHAAPTGWQGRFPYVFSTCGAALACYELAGGMDFICNEQWAIGAQNIAHTSAEARGAARKWGPEYWCAWNAHEWQTCDVPYLTDQKFDSCYVGYLQEYVFGTSIIVLESGAQGTQADQYTASYPGQPKEQRQPEGYDGEVARRYREVTKRFYDWVKANPRDAGTPETKIAMALGNLDAYLGINGGFTVWAQHANAATSSLWKYGAPEDTQDLLKGIFFPINSAALEPYGNSWLGGTPYGQADVVNVDDETTLADLRRYDLLVFGGWNTMMPLEKDVLERYVKNGGTLVMSRPELTTRVDRDYVGYTDDDLLPLFDLLPPEGSPGEYVETKVGKGRYFLFTAHEFPSASAEGRKRYEDLVRQLARDVKQTVTIDGDEDALRSIAYGVYAKKIYFLNTDTRHSREFTWCRHDGDVANAAPQTLTLAPCEIRVIDRGGEEEVPEDPWKVGSPDPGSIVAAVGEDGTLSIRGEGAMRIFGSFDETPWADVADSVSNLVIDSGITDVPAVALAGLTFLKTINGAAIPEIEAIVGPLEQLQIQNTSGIIVLDMKKLIFAAAAACAATASVAEGVISINISMSYGDVSGLGGTLPGLSGVEGVTAASWNDIEGLTSSEPLALKAWDAVQSKVVSPSGLTATWTIAGAWHQDASADIFRHAFANAAGSGNWSFDIKGIPFRKYGVILYSNYDGTPSDGWGPLRLNGTDWTCGNDGVGVKGTAGWGTKVNDSGDPAIYGQNAMRVSGLSGSDLAIANGSAWCNASAIQIVDETGFLISAEGDIAASEINAAAGAQARVWLVLPAGAKLKLDEPLVCTSLTVESEGDVMLSAPKALTADEDAKMDVSLVKGVVWKSWTACNAISINFATESKAMSDQPGFDLSLAGDRILSSSWNDIFDKTGEDVQLKVWNGVTHETETPEGATITWNQKGIWGDGSSACAFRRAWTLSYQQGPFQMTFKNIPFKKYDVIFYCNWDGSFDNGWGAVSVNGQYWTAGEGGIAVLGSEDSTWGQTGGKNDGPVYGKNAMRIKDVTNSTLTLKGTSRFNACALQIVESCNDYADIVAEGDITTKEVNRLTQDRKEVYLTVPAGATLTMSRSALKCEKLFVRCAGDLMLDTEYDPLNPSKAEQFNTDFAKIDFEHVAGFVYHGWKPTAGVISFNFGSDYGAMATQGGFAGGLAGEEIPAASWNDLADGKGTNETAKIWKGVTHVIESDIRAEWTSHGYYHAGSSPDLYRRGYCNTSGWGGWTLKVENIPFETYDVICTCNFDGPHQFSALKVNGTNWTCDADGIGVKGGADWGRKDVCDKDDPVTLGRNAFRIRGLSGSTLELGFGGAYCNCSAIQIVEPTPKRRYPGDALMILVK